MRGALDRGDCNMARLLNPLFNLALITLPSRLNSLFLCYHSYALKLVLPSHYLGSLVVDKENR
jgi:hypothetical protein